jgi:hypothetical protein
MSGIKTISFTENKVGKTIKSSKKKYSWVMLIDDYELTVDFYLSKLSRKLKLIVNNEIKYEGKRSKGTMVQIPFEFKEHQINLIQQGKIYDLRIDSVSFDYMLMQAKNKSEFKYEYKDIEDTPDTGKAGIKSEIPNPTDFQKKTENANVVSNNPFDLFEEPEEVKKTVEVQTKKLKPFSIKPPPPPAQVPGKGFGIFQAPEVKITKTQLAEDLFETPSKPPQTTLNLPDFPEVTNPFATGNIIQKSPSNQYYTGNTYYK